MGINIGKLIIKDYIEDIQLLNGKTIAFDTSNILYQFLSSIRLGNGNLIKNKKGETISHIYGLFHRVCFFINYGIKPVFVFDGIPPNIKTKTLISRKEKKMECFEKMNKALLDNNIPLHIKYSRRCSYITKDIIDSTKELLLLMGIPIVQSPCEGEAQAAFMETIHDVDYVVSQDYDTLLFGANNIIRNLNVTTKKKIELILLNKNLSNLKLTREQLIDLCLCIGTDFNDGFERVGYKTALSLIKRYSNIQEIIKHKFSNIDDINSILKARDFFLDPPISKNYILEWNLPDIELLTNALYSNYGFNREKAFVYCKKYYNMYQRNIFNNNKIIK